MTFLIFLFVHAASSIKGKIGLLQWFAKEIHIFWNCRNFKKKEKIAVGNGYIRGYYYTFGQGFRYK